MQFLNRNFIDYNGMPNISTPGKWESVYSMLGIVTPPQIFSVLGRWIHR